MTHAQLMRETTVAAREGGRWTEEERKRIFNEVRGNICSIFEAEWAPKIQDAAAKRKWKVDIILGPSGSPDAQARCEYGPELLKQEGYKVETFSVFGRGLHRIGFSVRW